MVGNDMLLGITCLVWRLAVGFGVLWVLWRDGKQYYMRLIDIFTAGTV